MGQLFFTSDNHFDHVNVIKYCRRPFLKNVSAGYEDWNLDVEAMNETMVQRWNSVVKPGDFVFHLGDFMLGPGSTFRQRLRTTRERLNGDIGIILGNHDRTAGVYLDAGFKMAMRRWMGPMPPQSRFRLHIRHHPPTVMGDSDIADLFLCGHVHEAWKRRGKVVNVGVDQWNFTPVTLEQLKVAPDEGAYDHASATASHEDSRRYAGLREKVGKRL